MFYSWFGRKWTVQDKFDSTRKKTILWRLKEETNLSSKYEDKTPISYRIHLFREILGNFSRKQQYF